MRDIALVLHFLALIIGAGAGFALFVISFLAPKFDERYRRDVVIGLFPLRYISYAGLLALILSGGMLLPAQQAYAATQLAFWLKMAGVLVIIICAGLGVIAMRRKDAAALKQLAVQGKISFAASVWVVVCAVAVFH